MLQAPAWGITASGPILDPNRHGIKRKPDILVEEVVPTPPPVKRFVSEEEMSLEMQRLQIETQRLPSVAPPAFVPHIHNFHNSTPGYGMSPFVFNSSKFAGFGEPPIEQDMDLLEAVKESPSPRLVISEEVSRIMPESPLPASIINASFPNNQMALVPYVPRPILVPSTENDDLDEEDNRKTEKVANFEEMELM